MVPASKSWRRGAAVAVLVFLLTACGSDDSATDAGSSVSGADDTSGNLAEADDHDDEVGDDHDDDDHGDEDADDDHDDEDHGDEDHEDEDAEHDDHGDEDDGDDHGDDDHDDHDDEDGSSGGLGAHEHGVAELSVAWSDGVLIVDLISPTFNIFGFEKEPSTDEERSLVTDRTDALTQPGVITLNAEAGCELADDVSTEVEFEGSHAELTASWMFNCDSLDEIRQLDTAMLFAEFPNLEDIDAQWVSPVGQSAAELSPASTVLSL